VRLQLKRDEEKDLAGGRAPLHGTSATAFLTAGLQIEQAQCVIKLDPQQRFANDNIGIKLLRSWPGPLSSPLTASRRSRSRA
jgi:hypothetical protein